MVAVMFLQSMLMGLLPLLRHQQRLRLGCFGVGELLASEGVVDGSVGSTGYWLMNPYDSSSMNAMTLDYGGANLSSSSASGYVKPALNLKQNVIITGGTGTQQDPFEIALS